jgi:hypothetical protein
MSLLAFTEDGFGTKIFDLKVYHGKHPSPQFSPERAGG